MKNSFFSVIAILVVTVSFSQTTMTNPTDFGKIKQWDMRFQNTFLGKVYTIENGSVEIVFNPTQNDVSNVTLAMSGTYTSETGQVAGFAYKGNQNIGDQFDPFTHKANSYIYFQYGRFFFSNSPIANSVQVYKVINNGEILSDIVNARTKSIFQWRFLVQKEWQKSYDDGTKTNGVDFLIVDFDIQLNLSEACKYVQGLQREDTKYNDFIYNSKVTACLLDTGVNYPFLLNGGKIHGNFNVATQSNVIVVK